MKIVVTSVFVDDQDKALRFYTDLLGFVKKTEIPMGDARWLTVVAPGDHNGIELLLEPDSHPAVGPFRRALMDDGIPFTSEQYLVGRFGTAASRDLLLAVGVAPVTMRC
jgi:catechol 2,3-dioxygenase-like lactoylglutathione lyase family enzyme